MIRIGSLRLQTVRPSLIIKQRCQRSILQYDNRSFYSTSSAKDNDVSVSDSLRKVMRRSAQPVAVITTNLPDSVAAAKDATEKGKKIVYAHGATLSSFTTVSLDPPLVAFSLRIPSRLADALSQNEQDSKSKAHFVINILSQKQELAANGFSKPGLTPFPLPETWKGEKGQGGLFRQSDQQQHPFTRLSVKASNTETLANSNPVIILNDSIGALSCSIVHRFNLQESFRLKSEDQQQPQTGGSDLFLAKVHSIENFKESSDRSPLIYCNRQFSTIQ